MDFANLRRQVPFCSNPKIIVNPYTHERVQVGCNECVGCLTHKAASRSLLCIMEEQTNKYCMFICLSYKQEYVPKMKLFVRKHGNIEFYGITKRCPEYGKKLIDYVGDKKMLFQQIRKAKFPFKNCLPYICKSDGQKFMKRLRYYLSKKTDEKIRYYIVAEYGPQTFRPHWHVLVYFSSSQTLDVFRECLDNAWKYGKITCSMSRGNCGNYCAGYVNSLVALPLLYRESSVKPVQRHSNYFGCKGFRKPLYRCRERERFLLDTPREDEYLIGKDIQCNGKNIHVFPPSALLRRVFPRCRGFSRADVDYLTQVYRVYPLARRYYGRGEEKDVVLATRLVKILYTRGIGDYYTQETQEKTFFRFLDEFLRRDVVRFGFGHSYTSEEKLINRVYSLLLFSKNFIKNVCDGKDDYDTICRAVGNIRDFYDKRDYNSLVDWYRSMSDVSFVCSDADEMAVFYSVPDKFFRVSDKNISDCYRRSSLYREMLSTVQRNYEKSIKHKKLNDANRIFC